MANDRREGRRQRRALAARAAAREDASAHLPPGADQVAAQLVNELLEGGGRQVTGCQAVQLDGHAPPAFLVGGEEGGQATHHITEQAERRTAAPGVGSLMGPALAVPTPNPPDIPGKRKKRGGLTARLKRLLEKDGGRHLDEIALALVDRAKGTSKVANDAARIILDRVDGPVVRKVEAKGEMHHRKTIVIRAGEELLKRAGEDAKLVDLELPELPAIAQEVVSEEAADLASEVGE